MKNFLFSQLISLTLLCFICIPSVHAQKRLSKKKRKQLYAQRVVKDTLDGHYIPKDLEDCFVQLNNMYADSTIEVIKAMSENEFSGRYHFSLGMWMRNNWGLWGGSRLSKFFNNMEIFHSDDMSGIIMTSYHRKLTNTPLEVEKQVAKYIAFWKRKKKKTK